MKDFIIDITILALQLKLELLQQEYNKTWLEIQKLKIEYKGVENGNN